MRRMVLVSTALVLCVCALAAQAPPPAAAPTANPLVAELRQAYSRVADYLLRMAEKMPEDQYAFQPVPEIRTCAGTLGHTIDMQMRTCASITGSGAQAGASAMTGKAQLVAAMKAAMAECDKAFASLTDESAVQMTASARGGQRSKLGSLYGMVTHDNEEYGYLAIYLRLKGVVPPSSEGGGMRGRGGSAF